MNLASNKALCLVAVVMQSSEIRKIGWTAINACILKSEVLFERTKG